MFRLYVYQLEDQPFRSGNHSVLYTAVETKLRNIKHSGAYHASVPSPLYGRNTKVEIWESYISVKWKTGFQLVFSINYCVTRSAAFWNS